MKEIKIGIVGVGRLGYEHACNIATRVPGLKLEAICDGFEKRAKEVAEELGVEKVYTDMNDMCKDPDVEAVAIVTNTTMHLDMIRIAMENGKHVFCEKPLAETEEKCREAEAIIKAHPELTFMLGFMRRFDKSYMAAKKKIENGDIGDVVMVRCNSQDPVSVIDGIIAYGPTSGGEFLDMSIHDIDLVRWFTGAEPKRVWSIGEAYAYKEFESWNDGDNVSCQIQCDNGMMATLFAGRTAAHGSHVETEIIGTKGALRIAAVPHNSLLEVMNNDGVLKECFQDFLSRWHDAFVTEMEYFRDCLKNGEHPYPDVNDGVRSTMVAVRCTDSFKSGEIETV